MTARARDVPRQPDGTPPRRFDMVRSVPNDLALAACYRRERRAVGLPIPHAIGREDAANAAGVLAAVLECLPA
jgi:hypothetical protein